MIVVYLQIHLSELEKKCWERENTFLQKVNGIDK